LFCGHSYSLKLHTSMPPPSREIEAEELRHELEEARIAEKVARLQLRDNSTQSLTSTSIPSVTSVTTVTTSVVCALLLSLVQMKGH